MLHTICNGFDKIEIVSNGFFFIARTNWKTVFGLC